MAPVPRYSATPTIALLSAGFRPFFLSAGLWACLAMVLWLAVLQGLIDLPTAFDPVAWHFHEFLFGFVVAAISGFLLTAVPNWTGRLPLSGRPLGTLVFLWWAGRIAVAVSGVIGAVAAAVIDLAFLAAFAGFIGREILAGRNWRNVPVLVVLSLLFCANLLIHTGVVGGVAWQDAGKRLAISLIVLLISLIGGRIVPSFTTNWLRRQEAAVLPVPYGRFDTVTLGVSVLALAIWTIIGDHAAAGAALVFAAVVQFARLMRWRGIATTAEPLVSVLHLGYLWVPLGLLLLGTGILWPPLGTTTALHALTVGAMATMILAVMTRASLGHLGRPLAAGRGTTTVYLLVTAAAVARLTAPFAAEAVTALLATAAILWIAAFALFVALYGPLYLRR